MSSDDSALEVAERSTPVPAHAPPGAAGARTVYRAFISYSHAADGRLAPALRDALHSFARRWYGSRAFKVFLDRLSLSASPGLWSAVERGLSQSEYLILLASPAAVRSPWIAREIEWWLTHRAAETLLIVLTDGDFHWDHAAGDFDWNQTTALPTTLRGRITEEPKYVDLRWARTEDTLSLHHRRFREAVIDLAATLHGRPRDELDGEDVRQHRIFRRAATAVAAVVAMLCVGLPIAIVYGYRQARTAQTQAQIAKQRQQAAAESELIATRQGAIALSQRLAANSTDFLMRDADLSLLLAVEATQRQDTREARKALFAALNSLGYAQTFLHVNDGQVAAVGFGANLRPLALTRQLLRDASGAVVGNAMRLWDLRAGKALGDPVTETRAKDNWIQWSSWNSVLTAGPASGKVARFSPDGRELAIATCLYVAMTPATRTDQGSSVCGKASIRIYAVTADGLQHKRSFDTIGWAEELAYSHDSQTVNVRACHRSQGGLNCSERGNHVFDVRPGQPDASKPANRVRELTFLSPTELVKQLRLSADTQVTRLAFGSDDRHVALGLADGRLFVVDAEARAVVQVLEGHRTGISDLSFSSNRTHLISASADGTILVHRVGQEHQLSRLLGRHDQSAEAVAFRPEGQVVISGGWDGTIRFWNALADDPPRSAHIGTIEDGLRSRVSCVSYSPDAKTVSSTSDNVVSGSTVAQFWDAETRTPIGRPVSTGSRTCRGFSPGKDVIALAGYGKAFLMDWRVQKQIGADIPAANGWVTDLFFRGSNERLVSADIEGRVMVWDLRNTMPAGSLLAHFHQKLGAAALNREQTLMAAGGDGWADLLELDTGRISNLPFVGSVVSVAFHPLDPVLVIGTRDAIFLWDLKYSEFIGGPLRTQHRLNQLAVNPDGGAVAAAYDDGSVLLWSLGLHNWRTIACRIVNRPWTGEEWRRFVGEADYRAECLQPAS